jgi:hypothetical protein
MCSYDIPVVPFEYTTELPESSADSPCSRAPISLIDVVSHNGRFSVRLPSNAQTSPVIMIPAMDPSANRNFSAFGKMIMLNFPLGVRYSISGCLKHDPLNMLW